MHVHGAMLYADREQENDLHVGPHQDKRAHTCAPALASDLLRILQQAQAQAKKYMDAWAAKGIVHARPAGKRGAHLCPDTLMLTTLGRRKSLAAHSKSLKVSTTPRASHSLENVVNIPTECSQVADDFSVVNVSTGELIHRPLSNTSTDAFSVCSPCTVLEGQPNTLVTPSAPSSAAPVTTCKGGARTRAGLGTGMAR